MGHEPEIPGRDQQWVDVGRTAATAIRTVRPAGTPWSRAQLLEVFAGLRSTGYLGSTIEKKAGGAGLELGQFASLTEGLASSAPFLSNHSVQRFIARSGSPEAKQQALPGLLGGTSIGAVAVTEPQGGSSLKNLRTRILPGRKTLLLTGRKDWVTHAMTADIAAVLAADEQGNRVRVLVDLAAPGVVREPLRARGLRHLTFGTLLFNEVEVEAWRILDEDGAAGAKAGFGVARVLVAVQAVALAFQALDQTAQYLATRTARGVRVIDLDITTQRLGALVAELQGARLLAYHAVEAVEAGHESAAALASGAKAHACAVAVRACTDLVAMCAGHGLDLGTGIADYRDDAEMLATADGTGLVNSILWGAYVKGHLAGCC
ncbi:acyl-CoA dehydrogenase family protein [Streptomyces melanosporofaciens]|uniref:Acyl-CoA dehydrogenase, N-terminal domain n=1 Tax=Streptomyces melanosporofaciens TaxID=67327 RepID=A0A1H4Z575_STRMJ|nr:acyl-CoA dehydrogenase family protein [Streptomyces melanosporofaciens]SED24490.1 Acyl-CoA dehydrogenase, N-terminal domain [Streptomyces melanosporofaciens]